MALIYNKLETKSLVINLMLCVSFFLLYACGSGGDGGGGRGSGSIAFTVGIPDNLASNSEHFAIAACSTCNNPPLVTDKQPPARLEETTSPLLLSKAFNSILSFELLRSAWFLSPSIAYADNGGIDCKKHALVQITAIVIDEDGEEIANGGPWACEKHGETITGVPVGDNRVIIVTAEGEKTYKGKSNPCKIRAGITEDGGYIELQNAGSVPPTYPDETQTNEDEAVIIDVISNDLKTYYNTAGNYYGTIDSKTVIITSDPSDGKAEINDDGTVTYTPNDDFNGNDLFSYTVKDNFGTTSDATDVTVEVIAINDPPVANAGTDQPMLFVGDTVTLNGSGSTDVDGDQLSYFWSFSSLPEGSEAELSDPTAVYPTFVVDVRDTYEAQLIVNDGIVDSEPDTVTINVENTPPVANAGTDQPMPPRVGDTVTLNGSGSTDVDGDQLSYFWSFSSLPEGSEAEMSDPTAVNPTFVVDVRDTYEAQLIVNDGIVDSEPDTVTINVDNTPPVAIAGSDQPTPLFVGDTVTLDGSGSTDVDGDQLSYSWSFTSLPEGSEAELSDPTAVYPTFVVDVRDTYVAQLIVNDGIVDSEPNTVTINVDNTPPVAVAGFERVGAGWFVGDTVPLNGSDSSDADGDPLSYFWSFTSRPEGSEAELSDPTDDDPRFVIDVRGTYVAQLIVNDGIVDSTPDTVTINVENNRPVAVAGVLRGGSGDVFFRYVGDTVPLDGSGSSDPDGDPLSYFWSFTNRPEGSEAELSDPTDDDPRFVIDVRGTYVAQLIVNDGTVDSEPDTVTIEVVNNPPVANAGEDRVALMLPISDASAAVTLDGSDSSDPDGDPLEYFWSLTPDVPEGSRAWLENPTTFNPTFFTLNTGEYVVQLIVNDGTLDSEPDTVTIRVQRAVVIPVPD